MLTTTPVHVVIHVLEAAVVRNNFERAKVLCR